jgi:hypothetical protein
MEKPAEEFVNELGNAIAVSVVEKDIDGVGGVLISISGPTSTTENHVTRMEAEIIYRELGKVLEDNQ